MSDQSDLAELGRNLHERLMAGDSVASALIAEAFVSPLVAALRWEFPYLPDPHLVQDQAHRSLLRYLKGPQSFDPSRRSLLGYLQMDASEKLRRRITQAAHKKAVELSLSGTEYISNDPVGEGDPETELIACEKAELIDGALREAMERAKPKLTGPHDQEFLALMKDGEHKTETFASVLGIENLNLDEQERIVKQHKDRIIKTLQRESRKSRSWWRSVARWAIGDKPEKKDG